MAVTINIKSTPPCIIRMQKSHTNTCINKKLSCVNRIENREITCQYWLQEATFVQSKITHTNINKTLITP